MEATRNNIWQAKDQDPLASVGSGRFGGCLPCKCHPHWDRLDRWDPSGWPGRAHRTRAPYSRQTPCQICFQTPAQQRNIIIQLKIRTTSPRRPSRNLTENKCCGSRSQLDPYSTTLRIRSKQVKNRINQRQKVLDFRQNFTTQILVCQKISGAIIFL